MAATLVAAIDHGTSSTRCILFDSRGDPAATARREQTMHYPQPGWVAVPVNAEMTATGAAYAAGLATGFWSDLDELRANYAIARRWQPELGPDERAAGVASWRRAVDRTLGLSQPSSSA